MNATKPPAKLTKSHSIAFALLGIVVILFLYNGCESIGEWKADIDQRVKDGERIRWRAEMEQQQDERILLRSKSLRQ